PDRGPAVRRPRALLRRRRRGHAPHPRQSRPRPQPPETRRRAGPARAARPGRLPRRGSRPRPVAGRPADPARWGRRRRGPRRAPPPVRGAVGRGGGRGGGDVEGGRVPELEVRPGLAPRRPREIIRNPRDTFPPDGAWRAEPLPEVTHGRRCRTSEIA